MKNPTKTFRRDFNSILKSDDNFVMASLGLPKVNVLIVAGEYRVGTGDFK